MKNKFYTEQKHKETMNAVDMLKGSINRMCVTDDINELSDRFTSAILDLVVLYTVNRKKLKERISQNDF